MRNDLKLVAAADSLGAIGKRSGELLFHIPEDMKRFKALTMGNTVIVGRKTLETFPNKMPLKGRETIVLSRQEPLDNGAMYCNSLEELFKVLDNIQGDIFVIGGGEIYKELLPYCNRAYITRINADGKGDVFLPELDKSWIIKEKSEKKVDKGIEFWFETYVKAKNT